MALLSQYQASPRVGHLEALYLIANYLSREPMCRIVFDPRTPNLDESVFIPGNWKDFYGDLVKEDPPDMPQPLGNVINMACFVDADHAGNKITRRSHTGIIIFLQNAPILAFSKRQSTCESSSYGSELVAMRIARNIVSAMRIKLKCFGIPIVGPCSVFCDNLAVVKNTSIPESVLAKKHNAINYHIIREAVAAGIIRIGKEDTETNIADAFTKLMDYSKKIQITSSFSVGTLTIHLTLEQNLANRGDRLNPDRTMDRRFDHCSPTSFTVYLNCLLCVVDRNLKLTLLSPHLISVFFP